MKLTLLAALTLLPCAPAFGIVIINDTISYPDGPLSGNGAWTTHSGDASVPVLVTSGAVSMSHGAGSRDDVGVNFGTRSFGSLLATFDLVVMDDFPITGTDFEYFAHFMTDGSFNFRSRLDIVAAGGGGDFSLGLATGSSTAEATLGADLTYGTAYSVALGFDFVTGLSSLSLDGGAPIISTTQFLGESLDRFALRQSNSSSDESIMVDNLVVQHIPEPATPLLGALALMFGLRRRR